MTDMAPPPPPKPKAAPVTLTDLQYEAECQLDLAMAKRDIMRQQGGEDHPQTIRQIRLLELIAEVLYTVALDKDRYREFALDIRAKYGRWVHPSERGAPKEPEASEE